MRFGIAPINWQGYTFFFSWLIVTVGVATVLSNSIGGQSGKCWAIASILLSVVVFIAVVKRKTFD